MDEPEPAVIRAAMAGDRAAFEEIVRTYQVPVWSFLTRLIGDRTLAEDLTQETFIRVYRRLPDFAFRSKSAASSSSPQISRASRAVRRRASYV